MEDLVVNCTAVEINLGGGRYQKVYLCKFCSSLTKAADLAHNCSNTNAPDALRGDASHLYYRAEKVEVFTNIFVINYEKIDPDC